MIEVKKLNITLSNKSILNEINLSFKEGRFYCIAGPNGSGKTTLLRTLTKVLAINNKAIFVDNKDINTISQKKISQKIGFVPQSSTLDCDFTAFDVVMMGRSPYQHPLQSDSIQDVRIVKEAMDFTDTWHLRHTPVRVLSGGEKQRIIIARALAQQTNILILDEPVSNLDILHQLEILQLLKRLNRDKNITIIAVLHDLNHILNYAQEVILLHHGNVIAHGHPLDVLNNENIKHVFSVNTLFIDNPTNGNKILITVDF